VIQRQKDVKRDERECDEQHRHNQNATSAEIDCHSFLLINSKNVSIQSNKSNGDGCKEMLALALTPCYHRVCNRQEGLFLDCRGDAMTAMPLPNDEDPLEIVKRLNAPDGADIIARLTDEHAQTVVDRLKAGADKYWGINPNRSLEMADTIIKIADVRANLSHKALGFMARGDALKVIDDTQEAWDTLGRAGGLYLDIKDEVGWARTRIGRIGISFRVNQISESLTESEVARSIFLKYSKNEFILRLDFNIAWMYFTIGDHQQSLNWYASVLGIAKSLGEAGDQYLGMIYLNMGAIYSDLLGDLSTASRYYQLMYENAIKRNEVMNITLAKHNLAYIALKQGKYSHALHLFYEVLNLCVAENFFIDANRAKRLIVECYLLLNRHSEARDLAIQVINYFKESGDAYNEAYTLLYLATAEAELLDLEGAKEALDLAEHIFTGLGANTWVAITNLRRGQLFLKKPDISLAHKFAALALRFFESSPQKIHLASAVLLDAQISFLKGDVQRAEKSILNILKISRQANLPLLRYGAHLLSGHISRAKGDIRSAIRQYQAAIATIARIQQELAITIRPEFLDDKEEGLHALIALFLTINNFEGAFEILERTKSQVFFNYVSNRQLLRWPEDDPKCRESILELDKLRGEHYWWYQKAHAEIEEDQNSSTTISQAEAIKEVALRERRIREITEQLYIQGSANALLVPATMPHLSDIQKCLDNHTLLIEFYQNEDSTWAFMINNERCTTQLMPVPMMKIERDLRFLHFNIDTILNVHADLSQTTTRTLQGQRLLRQLYDALLAPFASELKKYTRLIFVPYSALHYLPFHLLYDGSSYLIEHHEVVIQPAAGYVTQRGPQRSGGARAIAHSRGGALLHSQDEARFVYELFGGTIVQDDGARRSALENPPVQILHIAAHAEYRPQQPDLSYIELADGHLLTDDLLQQDMSYELVTLSACETARAHVAAGDELIGLGRGFLYAGAGALVSSLWRVADDMTLRLMEHFYLELHAGASKSAALRNAQLAILSEDPQLHPAFWGAFQLVGDSSPLSTQSGTQKPKHKR
jgi:CHAT domain-containing protein